MGQYDMSTNRAEGGSEAGGAEFSLLIGYGGWMPERREPHEANPSQSLAVSATDGGV
jgi:hypothetical protein